MFNLNNLFKLKDFNYVEDIVNCVPKGNTGIYTNEEVNNAISGSILCCFGELVRIILGILVATGIMLIFGNIPETDTFFKVNIGLGGILSIVFFIGTALVKGKKHSSWYEVIMLVFIAIKLIGDVIGIADALFSVLVNPLYTVLTAVLLVIDLVGLGFLILSYLGFAKRLSKEYKESHMVKTFAATEGDAQVQEQMKNTFKTCPYCNTPKFDDFPNCQNCGAKVE